MICNTEPSTPPMSPNRAHEGCMAEDAVRRETVSRAEFRTNWSPQTKTGKLTGNFADCGPSARRCWRRIHGEFSQLQLNFPTLRNREFSPALTGKILQEQGIFPRQNRVLASNHGDAT